MAAPLQPATTHGDLPRRERIVQQLRLLDRDGEVAISFAGCIEYNLGLNLRKRQVRRSVASITRESADFFWESDTLIGVALSIGHPAMTSLLDRLTERLSAIAERPLTPRELLAALPITNRERLRWTKDHRLTRSGGVQIKQGQIVTIPTYSVSAVESILVDRAILDRWREADRLIEAERQIVEVAALAELHPFRHRNNSPNRRPVQAASGDRAPAQPAQAMDCARTLS
jgi:hypothetical protein